MSTYKTIADNQIQQSKVDTKVYEPEISSSHYTSAAPVSHSLETPTNTDKMPSN